ncbi:sodium- and chloride-dependent neutral and basic amino acid transporter B(0+)-like [Narcine bancroftii]|uniref:sodium- and chloride-dependent neutral and basic amino acid transporter B(0+)-like n=1 Tax=Narcine bancroftii TaxID=1343680 RepID=UPI00383205E7
MSDSVKQQRIQENYVFCVQSSSEFEDLWVPSRDQWSSKADYLLSIIGYAVGLGNFWRFPYLVYKNGGGAFVIPYVIMLAIVGMPLFFLECSRGQFSSSGPISAWKAVPLLQGVGVSKIIVSAFVTLYYNCIIAYSIYYFFASLQFPLPWSKCFDWWNAEETCSNNLKGVIYNITLDNSSHKLIQNATCINGTEVQLTQYSSAEYYWNQIVLQRSNSINETGGIIWDLALCLLLAWLIVLLILCKGIKSSGKVAYFTATFPYLILLILLVRGVTLEGARSGIDFYIGKESDFSKLTQAEVWKDACCTNTSVALGDLTSLSSFNKFNNNCYRDAIIITSVNSITSLLAGFANFAILGHMAFQQQKTVKQVAESGLGLIFIAYPNGLALLPISSFWSVFFFFMLITLGINSQFVMIETIVATIKEELPQMKFKFLHVLIIICVSLYLFGLLLITKAGIYWIELIDTFSTGWNILLVGFLELVGIIWIYGK